MLTMPAYVVITPARNEERSIELTIKSMVAQTVRPIQWVIVSDGSTDATDAIVREYASRYCWIELLRLPERKERHFAAKVDAFNAGLAKMECIPYEIIVSLDADITFDSNYFSFLLEKLVLDPSLGVVGTPFRELSNEIYDYRFVSIEHVSGACQVFRRKCFESIGGYVPVKVGAIDNIAVVSARMRGWKTRTFTEQYCLHHRKMGTGGGGYCLARFKNGNKDYAIGNHPLWEIFRIVYQLTKKPYGVGGAVLAAGYGWSFLKGAKRPVSAEFVHFLRQEQLQRLRNACCDKLSLLKGASAIGWRGLRKLSNKCDQCR